MRRPAVVADANALISDVMRRSRSPHTALAHLPQDRRIRLLAPEHIDAKVYARLPRACASGDVHPELALRVYESLYRPYLTLVDVGDTMMQDPRVGEVARADAEDVPVAQLGVLLSPSLILTRDVHLLGAGLGAAEWARALIALATLLEIDETMWGGAAGVRVATVATWEGATALARLLRRSQLASVAILALTAYVAWKYRSRLGDAPAVAKELGDRVAAVAIPEITRAFERRDDVDQRVRPTLVVPDETATLEQAIARVLLQHEEPITARAIHAILPVSCRENYDVNGVMSTLRDHRPFELLRGRGWRLGHQALAPAASKSVQFAGKTS